MCICELEDKILSETLLNLALNRKMDELILHRKTGIRCECYVVLNPQLNCLGSDTV